MLVLLPFVVSFELPWQIGRILTHLWIYMYNPLNALGGLVPCVNAWPASYCIIAKTLGGTQAQHNSRVLNQAPTELRADRLLQYRCACGEPNTFFGI